MTLQDYLALTSSSPREFAEKVGVSQEAVRLWLKGARRPRDAQVEAIIRVTGGKVGAADLFEARSGRAA